MLRRIFKTTLLAGFALVGLEAAYAVLRPAPRLPEFDASGVFGHEEDEPLTMVVIGDSSVTAPGVSDIDRIWVRDVARRIAEHRNVHLHSLAIGGATTGSVIRDQLDDAVALGPRLALVSVGANDAIRSLPLGRFDRELEEITTRLQEAGALVLLSGVADLGTIPRLRPPLRGIITRRSLAYDNVHRRLAERTGAIWLNPRQDDRELWLRDRSLWSEDLFHVSAYGHSRWADATWRVVAPVLADL